MNRLQVEAALWWFRTSNEENQKTILDAYFDAQGYRGYDELSD